MQSKVSSMTSIVVSSDSMNFQHQLEYFFKIYKEFYLFLLLQRLNIPEKMKNIFAIACAVLATIVANGRLKLFAVSTFATNVSSRISLGMQRWVDNWYMWMLCCGCQSKWGKVWPWNFYSGGQMWLWLEMQKTECQCWRNMRP